MQENEKRRIVDSAEAATILNKHISAVYRYVKNGTLVPVLNKRGEGTSYYFYEDEVLNFAPRRRGRRKGDPRNKGLKPWLSQHAKHVAGMQRLTENQERVYKEIENKTIRKIRIPSRESNSLKVLIRRGFVTAEVDHMGCNYINMEIIKEAPIKKSKKT